MREEEIIGVREDDGIVIGAFEAKTQFSRLLDRVRHGSAFTVTLRGEPIAKIIPYGPGHSVSRARKAADRLLAFAKAAKTGQFEWENEWKRYRDEGRP